MEPCNGQKEKNCSWHYFKLQARCLELRTWPIGEKIVFNLPWAPSVEIWAWCMAEKINFYWPLTFNTESRRPKTKKILFGHAWNFQALQWAWLKGNYFSFSFIFKLWAPYFGTWKQGCEQNPPLSTLSFGAKGRRLKARIFLRPCLELLSMARAWPKASMKWKKKLKWNERKTWKHENLGLNKKFYLKLLRMCVTHLLQEYQHNEYIHENLKQKQ